jgi:hypothetical protein
MHDTMHELLHRPILDAAPPAPHFWGPATNAPGALENAAAEAIPGPAANDPLRTAPPRGADLVSPERSAYLREAAERLSTALLNVVHQPTAKGRDRSLAALVALIYGPTPFGGVNSLRDVAMRYGMTEQNLFHLMRGHRESLSRAAEPEYEI